MMAMSLQRFASEIKKLGRQLEVQAVVKLTQRAAKATLAEWRSSLPKGETGNLRRSITMQRAKSKRRGQWVVGLQMAVAPHANIINPGRRRGKRGFMVGSKQSGRGHISRKVIKKINAHMRGYVEGTVGRLF